MGAGAVGGAGSLAGVGAAEDEPASAEAVGGAAVGEGVVAEDEPTEEEEAEAEVAGVVVGAAFGAIDVWWWFRTSRISTRPRVERREQTEDNAQGGRASAASKGHWQKR